MGLNCVSGVAMRRRLSGKRYGFPFSLGCVKIARTLSMLSLLTPPKVLLDCLYERHFGGRA